MNRTLLGLVVAVAAMGAQVARADDFDGDDGYHPAAPVQTGRGCGARPQSAPQGQVAANGLYELQNTQRWVPGSQQQVWVPGQCYGGGEHHRRGWGRGGGKRCAQGSYQVISSPGHYETTQQWVWVSSGYRRQPYGQQQYQAQPSYQQYGGGAGFKVQSTDGTFSMSVY